MSSFVRSYSNVHSLCPMNSDVPITGEAIIPVSKSDVSGIPDIALVIPDFEGSATLRIWSNSSQTQIGCYQAIMRNGATFSQPAAVGSVLGIFTMVALLASFATAIYGASIPAIRTHYAHSLSMLVIFEVYHYIYFSGALSLNWPSVLPAFWSNFAWTAGQIHSSSMISSINSFTGVSGNSSQVGDAGSTQINNNGGLQQQIYGRSLRRSLLDLVERSAEIVKKLVRRAVDPMTTPLGYSWSGRPEAPGLPVPGNWSRFAGTLSDEAIPAADSFLVGFIWLLILGLILVAATIAFKWSLEGFSSRKWIKESRLSMFRSNWVHYVELLLLRITLIAFPMIMILTLFQFSYGGKAGPIAIAVIVFLLFFVGIFGLAFLACYNRLRSERSRSSPERLQFQPKKVSKLLPLFTKARGSSTDEGGENKNAAAGSMIGSHHEDDSAPRESIHQDQAFIRKFGWLAARFRRTRWWFFAYWVVYQFIRACFVGGARASPMAQVAGLFAVEVIALVAVIWIRPFESARNTALAVYMLSIAKVLTSGLSIAFLPSLNLARIPTTVIGIVIIVIQGFLVIALLILIVLGAISSYMSLMRNREEFRPRRWEGIRLKYFANMEKKAPDVPPPPPPPPEEPKEPYFSVNNVHRAPKIEDEDVVEEMPDLANIFASQLSLPNGRRSRTNSMRSSNVPFGARVHRASWSSRDFQMLQETEERPDTRMSTAMRSSSAVNLVHPSFSNSNHPSASNSAQPSANNSRRNSIRTTTIVRPPTSLNNSGPTTPTTPSRETLEAHAHERFNQPKREQSREHIGEAKPAQNSEQTSEAEKST